MFQAISSTYLVYDHNRPRFGLCFYMKHVYFQLYCVIDELLEQED